MRALILGSKEYPLGTSDGSDPSPSGGMELYVQGLANALSSKGVHVTVITRRFSCSASDETLGGTRVLRVPFVSGFFLRNPSFNAMSFFRALRLDYDVIISNGEIANLFGLLLSRLKGRPVVMVSHGLASTQPQYNPLIRTMFRIIDRLTYPSADAVVTHAPRQMAGITERFHVIMPGVERPAVKASPGEKARLRTLYAGKGRKVVVYTGRLIAVKGLDVLIRSLKFVKTSHVLVIVGDGPDRKRLEHEAASERAHVVFAGFSREVGSFLSMADAFVLPSYSESLNYSLLEAALIGVPIVCTDIGIIGSDAAELAAPGDELSLAAAISRVLESPDSKKVARAKARAERFDWGRCADAYIKIMRSLVR